MKSGTLYDGGAGAVDAAGAFGAAGWNPLVLTGCRLCPQPVRTAANDIVLAIVAMIKVDLGKSFMVSDAVAGGGYSMGRPVASAHAAISSSSCFGQFPGATLSNISFALRKKDRAVAWLL